MDAGGELPNSKLSFRDHLVILEKMDQIKINLKKVLKEQCCDGL